MAVAGQVFTLIGVALGALSSYLITSLNERSRYRRDIAARLQERKFDAYAEYLTDVRQMVIIANRIAASAGLHNRTTLPLSPEEGLPLLAELTTRRTTSSERAKLLASEETGKALRILNQAGWHLECIARDVVGNRSTQKWEDAMRTYWQALSEFHRSVRQELGVPGRALDRPDVPAPAMPLDGLLFPSDPPAIRQ